MELTARARLDRVVRAALAEDVGARRPAPPTASFRPTRAASAELLLEEPGVVCGLDAARAVFEALDPDVRFEPLLDDGDARDRSRRSLARIEGPARAVLTGERTALNLLGRLCGIATLTARYVAAVEGTGATILDTRKTTPGLRALEKYAVRCGGGANHRFGLDDAILVKENHLRIAGGIAPGGRGARAERACPIEVEAETLADVREALAAGVDRILLDNMTPGEAARRRRARRRPGARSKPRAASRSRTSARIAETGVDFISVGALTHSARSLDVSLEVR